MTIPIWPIDLPQRSLVQGFQSSARGNRLTTAPDVGPSKQRRRGPAIRPVTCAIMVEMDGRARFDRFFEEELNFGVTPFLLPDQQIDGNALYDESWNVLLDENDVPIVIDQWWLAQFGQSQPATSAISGMIFTIQFDLLVLP
jgi:hypothetical protein